MQVELAHTPLEYERDGILAVGESVHPERLANVATHEDALGIAGQLEDATAGRQDAGVLVACEQPRSGRREPVLEDLEEEAEPAAVAADRLVRESLETVGIEHPRGAVR